MGHEFGTTTGRPRRCGWLDLVALRYAVRLNGITGLVITKLDVLNDLETIKVCTAYRYRDEVLDEMPPSQSIFDEVEPVYEKFRAGRATSVTCVTSAISRPETIDYLNFITASADVPARGHLGRSPARADHPSRLSVLDCVRPGL